MSEQRRPCIACGVNVRDGIEHANDHDPDCRLVPEWNDEDARVKEADRIVRALAETSPFYDHNGCAYCGHDCNSEGTDPHAGDCIYARAVRYVEASK
jgi:hypothetical protein